MRAKYWLLILPIAALAFSGCEEEGSTDLAAEAAEGGEGSGSGSGEAADTGAKAAEGEGEAAPDAAAKPARRFVKVEGKVTIDGEAAAVDGEIGETAKIETGKDGYAVITLHPGGVIEIRKGTSLELGKSERKDISIKLLLGAIWSFVPDAASYEVETTNAVAGVRGTVFYTESLSKKKSYICACNGEVEITGKKLKKSVTSSMEHKAFSIKSKGKKKVKAKKAKRERHTDEEKDALIALMETTK